MSETPDQFEADLQAVCAHECGHFECNRAFGIPSVMQVVIDDDGSVREGWCLPDFSAPVKFEDSVVSWGGTVAEYLTGYIWRHGPPEPIFPLNEKFIERWHDWMMCNIKKFSASDRHGILASHENTLESCQHCFRVLTRRLRELKEDAGLLADKTRIERDQKLAAVRAEKELLKRMEVDLRPVFINGQPKVPVSIGGRASVLAEFIERLHPNDPRRVRLAPALASFEHGVIPELNGELNLTVEEMMALTKP